MNLKDWENPLMVNLKFLLDREKIDIPMLSEKTKVPERTIYNWISGKCYPKTDWRIKAISDYFRITVDELCYSIIATFGKVDEIQKPQNYDFNNTNRVPLQLDIFGIPGK